MAARPGPADGPVAEFCAALRAVRIDSGLRVPDLAKQLNISRSQLYLILKGGIAEPPSWAGLVQPLLERCLPGSGQEKERLISAWQHRYAVTAALHKRLGRQPQETPAARPPRTLPRDIMGFTGRDADLQELLASANGAEATGGVFVIGGMPGIGKTALAVHAAHRLAEKYPDGQVFLPLHGHSLDQKPVEAEAALTALLMTIGVPTQRIADDAEIRASKWRDLVASKQLLLVLDDAVSTAQVRLLLPGTGRSLVLITSRRRLTDLADATELELRTLPQDEAEKLFVALAGRAGLDLRDDGVADLVRICGRLPLAIGMLARQLHHHRNWTPATMARDLETTRDRLDWMVTEDRSVAAAIDLSYDALNSGQRRVFRLLGLHPGADFDLGAVAALSGTQIGEARRDLLVLYDRYLVGESAGDRYSLHDLIRERARGLADRDDSDSGRKHASTRLADYYQCAVAVADERLARFTRSPLLASRYKGDPEAWPGPPLALLTSILPKLTDWKRAAAWARAERANLLACLDQAERSRQHAQVVALTAAMAGLLRLDGPWADGITRHGTAVEAARQTADRLGEANALTDLGTLQRLAGRPDAARASLTTALTLCRQAGDRQLEANVLCNLGALERQLSEFAPATKSEEAAVAICLDIGDAFGHANALTEIGAIHYGTGGYAAAIRAEEEALALYRQHGDVIGEANALHFLGAAQGQTGQYEKAADSQRAALKIYREVGDDLGQANTLQALGATLPKTYDYQGAMAALMEALDNYRRLGQRLGEATALLHLGAVHRLLGDLADAADHGETALEMFRDLGDGGGEAEALNELGIAYRVQRRHEAATRSHREALKLAQAQGSRWDEAHALAGLGRCAVEQGNRAVARSMLKRALGILRKIESADAADVAADLEWLDDTGAAS
jgi:tetratricopeptide (TPR) repeat protein